MLKKERKGRRPRSFFGFVGELELTTASPFLSLPFSLSSAPSRGGTGWRCGRLFSLSSARARFELNHALALPSLPFPLPFSSACDGSAPSEASAVPSSFSLPRDGCEPMHAAALAVSKLRTRDVWRRRLSTEVTLVRKRRLGKVCPRHGRPWCSQRLVLGSLSHSTPYQTRVQSRPHPGPALIRL